MPTTSFGYCLPIFASAGGAHQRTPLLEEIDFDQMEASVLAAERLGYASLWVADHLILGREGAILECWTALSALARVTKTIRLGTIHLANRFRSPALAAKMAATLDYLSNGRVDFFFDPYAGSRPEAVAYGFPTPDEETAFAQFEEAVQLIKRMWTDDNPTFSGDYYTISGAICRPRPVQQPSIPFWIGTQGNPDTRPTVHKVLPMIARHADWFNSTPLPLSSMRTLLELLDQACTAIGRDPRTLKKSLETQILIAETTEQVDQWKAQIETKNPNYGDWDRLQETFIIGDVETAQARVQAYVDLGIEHFMFWFMDYPAVDGMKLFAERLMPSFQT